MRMPSGSGTVAAPLEKGGRRPLQHIIVATDGSVSGRAAVELAVAEAAASGAALEAVSAWSLVVESEPGSATLVPQDLVTANRTAMIGTLEDARRIAAAAGVPLSTRLVAGDAARGIIQAAAELDAGLIVIGSRGRSPWRAALLGSVAAHVLQRARCPVLVVPGLAPA